jgi:HEAT repeat protein
MVALAEQGDVERLAHAFARMPLRDILAVRALVAHKDAYATLVDALLNGLSHPEPRMRYDCAHALDHFADDRCLEPLHRLLDDPVPRVRRMALHVLSCDRCKLTPLAPDEDLSAVLIERALADPSINVRRQAVVALGSVCGEQDASVVATLETLLIQERDLAIHRNARWALRRRAMPTP